VSKKKQYPFNQGGTTRVAKHRRLEGGNGRQRASSKQKTIGKRGDGKTFGLGKGGGAWGTQKLKGPKGGELGGEKGTKVPGTRTNQAYDNWLKKRKRPERWARGRKGLRRKKNRTAGHAWESQGTEESGSSEEANLGGWHGPAKKEKG